LIHFYKRSNVKLRGDTCSPEAHKSSELDLHLLRASLFVFEVLVLSDLETSETCVTP